MNIQVLNNLSNSYNLSPVEISCILLNFVINNKTLAFSYTISYQSKSKNKDVLAGQFFRRESVQRFISEQKSNFIVNEGEYEDRSLIKSVDQINEQSNRSKEEFNNTSDISGISGENIKELLEREYNKTTDPEKRTVLLIKIADFIGLKNNDQDDPLTPTIYLPSRCQNCLKH